MNKKPLIIKANRVELHSIAERNSEEMIGIITDKEVALTYMLPKFNSRDEAYTLFKRFMQLSTLEDRFVYGIFLDATLIGFINDVCIKDNSVELGCVISPQYKGNGYATEVVSASIVALFEMGFNTVIAGAFESNIASIRVMEKSGMTKCDYTETVDYNGETFKCIMYNIKKQPE